MAFSSVPAMEVERESTRQPNWLELPTDLTLNILQRLGAIEIITSACLVCHLWWNICKDPQMWRTIRMSKFRYLHYHNADLVKMCRIAVQRSCGQLEDIDIQSFGTDDLLELIANSASHLRRIRFVYCYGLSGKGLSEAVKKLPLLEELDISHNYYLTYDSFEVVGRCCPLLKSLTYGINFSFDQGFSKIDDEAFAIAKTMPTLRHLTIVGNTLTINGFIAILDECRLLESLDLRDLIDLDLYFDESMRNRCYEQIKDFRLPFSCYIKMRMLMGVGHSK